MITILPISEGIDCLVPWHRDRVTHYVQHILIYWYLGIRGDLTRRHQHHQASLVLWWRQLVSKTNHVPFPFGNSLRSLRSRQLPASKLPMLVLLIKHLILTDTLLQARQSRLSPSRRLGCAPAVPSTGIWCRHPHQKLHLGGGGMGNARLPPCKGAVGPMTVHTRVFGLLTSFVHIPRLH